MHDLVIRGGRVVDGSGAAERTADVAIDDGRISDVGQISDKGRREIDADGLVVTPGFVDIHTHYDAQATWDPHLLPSGWHGVTTAVCGNCGVGFAPAAPDRHEFLIELMEGVEDIPGAALSEGIDWQWETFPEYLDALERSPLAVDLGTQVPHGAVRAYVMGERGARNEAATAEDIEKMAAIVREGIAAGALGFSTSRTMGHKALDGEPVPGTFAQEDELFGIGRVLGELGRGVFELAPDGSAGDLAGDDAEALPREAQWMRRLTKEIGRPVAFAMLQFDSRPDQWRELLDICAASADEGGQLIAQSACRPFGILAGLQTMANPFAGTPTYQSIADLPLEERAARMAQPEVRERILAEHRGIQPEGEFEAAIANPYGKLFPMGDPPNYEPTVDDSIEAIARRAGRPADEVTYEYLLRDGGRELLLLPYINYSNMSCDPHLEMLQHPQSVLSLGDGGAHCGVICDASLQTFMLTHWVRDRTRGDRLKLEEAVRCMTSDTARLYDLNDRGLLAPGYKGDVNLIDLEGLTLRRPEMAYDLPAGARRLMQRAEGYEATIVSGEVVMERGETTDARPGRLLRGPQASPSV